ncbi:hypothetical protein [Rubritalea tangerina]|uniref:hypothetical protein n=1 Tax=Rubritalea tangerina TaxID=430798 RepID=UPI003620872F
MLLRILTEINCFSYQLKYWRLRQITRKKFDEMRKNKAENVFVFANGPSLSCIDFSKIKSLIDCGEFDLIVVNNFASKVIEKYDITPTLGVFADPVHYGERPEVKGSFDKDISVMNDRNIPAMVPYRYYDKSKFSNSVPYSGVRNVFRTNVSDLSKPLGYMYLSALHALSSALYIGYENVYICGYDNSYFKSYGVDDDGSQFFQDEHFYDAKVGRRYLPESQYGPTSFVFYDTYRHFKYLEKVQRYASSDIGIKNIAKMTYTNSFERDFSLNVYK